MSIEPGQPSIVLDLLPKKRPASPFNAMLQNSSPRLQLSTSKEIDLLTLAISKQQLRINLKSQILLSGEVERNTEIEGHESNQQKLNILRQTSSNRLGRLNMETRGGAWVADSENELEYASYWLERIDRCLGATSIETIQKVGYYSRLSIEGEDYRIEQKDLAHLPEKWRQIFISECTMFGKVYEDVEMDEEILDFHHLIVEKENSAVNYEKFDLGWFEKAYSPNSYETIVSSKLLDK